MPRLSFVFLLTSLLGGTLATVPNPFYRADARSPDKIKATEGFKNRGNTEAITIMEHVSTIYAKGP